LSVGIKWIFQLGSRLPFAARTSNVGLAFSPFLQYEKSRCPVSGAIMLRQKRGTLTLRDQLLQNHEKAALGMKIAVLL
jgi:hypothetical protein